MDYNWLTEFKKTYSASKPVEQQSFISLSLEEETPKRMTWEVKVQKIHEISRKTLILLLSTAIQTKIYRFLRYGIGAGGKGRGYL